MRSLLAGCRGLEIMNGEGHHVLVFRIPAMLAGMTISVSFALVAH